MLEHDENMRKEILASARNGYIKQFEADLNGTTPLYRERSFNREERDKIKEEKPKLWYKGKNDEYKQMLMIDATPNGELKKEIEELKNDCCNSFM